MKKYLIISPITFITVILTILILFPKQIVDDSYILFRYAENFKNGNGLVWNVGEYTESYTGILLILFYIISPLSYIITAYIIGVVSFLLGGYIIYLIAKESPVKWLLLVCYSISPAIYVHVFSGLETCLFMTLSLAAIYSWRENKEHWLLLVTILLFLCRPEGIIYAILLSIKNKGNKE